MQSSHRPVILALTVLAIASSGCTNQLREYRRLARAQRDVAADKYDEAEVEYRSAIAINPANSDSVGHLGALYVEEGRILPGFLLLRQAMQGGAEDPQLRLAYALACLTVGRTADARNAAKKVLDGDPGNEKALLLLVDTSVTARDSEETRQLVEALRSKYKDVPGFHLALGALDLAKHDQAGAEREFQTALSLDPGSAAAYEGLGNLWQLRKDPKQAEDDYRKAAELSPLRSPLRLKYTELLIQNGSLDEARKSLADLSAKAPDCIPIWAQAMQLAATQKRYDDSLAAAAEILKRDPMNYEALARQAGIKLTKGDADGALADLKVAQGYYPRVPLIKYQLALAYQKKGDDTAAEESLNQAILLAPNFEEALQLLAELQVQKGDPQPAINELRRVLKLRPGNLQAVLLLAQAYRQQGNLEECLRIYQGIAQAMPKEPFGQYMIGMGLFEERKLPEARAQFERAIKLTPDYWPALEMLVSLDLLEHRYEPAAKRVEALVAKYPKVPEGWLLKGRVDIARQDSPGAEASLLRAIDLDPTLEYAYLRLARVYFQHNDAQKALEKLAAIADTTKSVTALMQLGMIHSGLKEYDAARKAYERLLEVDPHFVPALNNLASLYAENLGQLDNGLRMAQQVHDQAPDNPVVADTLGWIHYLRGEYEAALPLLRQGAEKLPDEPEPQFHLAMAYYRLGQEDQARQSFQKLLAETADSPFKGEGRARLALLALDPIKVDATMREGLEARAQQEPDDPVIWHRLAAVEEQAGSYKAAEDHYERVLKLAPHSMPVLMALAQLYSDPAKGTPDFARARELAATMRTLAPNDLPTTKVLGRIFYRTGDYKRSLDLLQEAAQSQPDDLDLQYDLALAEYDVGRVDEATAAVAGLLGGGRDFARSGAAKRFSALLAAAKSPAAAEAARPEAEWALGEDPASIPALMVSGLALEQEGSPARAGQTYDKILAQDPDFAPATRRLAILYAERLGDDKKAEGLALKARQAYPDDPDLAYELGALNYRKGDFSTAVKFLHESLGKRDNDAETYFFLGMSHYELKFLGESRDELQRALDLHLPVQESDEAKRVLEELNRNDGTLGLPGSN